ncbi:hypothetical protein BDZ89DRAFT_1043931 [Hymenopellis radicata]|nr:hypothetical protein BDZ89DRAFT_1043931 [Hymenopellis radicata]
MNLPIVTRVKDVILELKEHFELFYGTWQSIRINTNWGRVPSILVICAQLLSSLPMSTHYSPLPLHAQPSTRPSFRDFLNSRAKQHVRRPLILTALVLTIVLAFVYLRQRPYPSSDSDYTYSLPVPSLEDDTSDAAPSVDPAADVAANETTSGLLMDYTTIRDGVVYHPFLRPTTLQLVKDTFIRPIQAHLALSDACVDHWITRATWDGPCLIETVTEATIDLVYTWVNGSDLLHQASRSHFIEETGHHPLNARFREHDELRHSVRSAYEATQKWRNNTWHIITADIEDPEDATQRLGLVPQWLNTSASQRREGGRAPIYLHHGRTSSVHPAFWNLIIDTQIVNSSDENEYNLDEIEAWREQVLPTFNRKHKMPPSAFHSTLYGPVFRVDTGRPIGGDDSGQVSGAHEWRSMGWSDHLLNQRFGNRKRSYIRHNARSFSLPLMHEASMAYADFFSWTPLSRFRGSHGTPPEIEVNTVFLSTHFVIERHREALLWSWIVAKWGGENGILDTEKKAAMWREVGGSDEAEEIPILLQSSSTSDAIERNMRSAGLEPPESQDPDHRAHTVYAWVSLDGFAVSHEGGLLGDIMKRADCLGYESERAWDLFRRVIMHDVQCGDALISTLKVTSPDPGLSVFLPPKTNHSNEPLSPTGEAQILPLSLPEDPPPVPTNPRAFASPTRFFGITSYNQGRMRLKETDQQKDIAFLCINDDMPEDERGQKASDNLYRQWLEKKWPTPLDCELRVKNENVVHVLLQRKMVQGVM